MQQTTEETKKETSKLVRFVKRLTGCEDFPNIGKIAQVAESNSTFRESVYGIISLAYNSGLRGIELDEGAYGWISREVPNEDLRSLVGSVQNHGRTKSGRFSKPYFS